MEASATAPDKHYVYKDILRTGTFTGEDGSSRTFRRKDLQRMAKCFYLAKMRGFQPRWIDEHEGGIKDKLGTAVDFHLRGDVLYAKIEVESDDGVERFAQYQGQQTNVHVSPEIKWDYVIDGKRYPIIITHIANVLQGAMKKQGAFIRLSQPKTFPRRSTKGVFRMADDTTKGGAADDSGGDGGSATSIEVSRIVEMLAEQAGIQLAGDPTTERELEIAFANYFDQAPDDQTDDQTSDNVPIDLMTGDTMQGSGSGGGMMMSQPKVKETAREKQFRMAAEKATNELNTFRMAQAKAEDDEYAAAVDALHVAKKIDATVKEKMIADAKGVKHSFRMGQLALVDSSIKGGSTFRMANKVDGTAPRLPSNVPDAPSDEDCKAAAQRIRNRQFTAAAQ